MTSELMDADEFFAPMSADLVDGLIGQYNAAKAGIMSLAEAVRAGQNASALHYFIEANCREGRHSMPSTVDALFAPEPAIHQLDADYWNRALMMTDVYDYMPEKRRRDWHEQISNPQGVKKHRCSNEFATPPLPAFEEETVRATLHGLLASRAQFFAERVDGIFQRLSREHVTNQPQGFGKRMILAGVVDGWGTPKCGHINDLRCVIAKFMGRDEPGHNATDPVVRHARYNSGQWITIDGGALRIRVYAGVGTAHLEIHPDMAWRLNAVLANLYPMAIPSEFRTKPKRQKKLKEFSLFDRPLPFAVVNALAAMEPAQRMSRNESRRGGRDWQKIRNSRLFRFGSAEKAVITEARRVLEAIGGVETEIPGDDQWLSATAWMFDYDPSDVIADVVASGCIPDQKSHQYYPTPESLATRAIELAQIGDGHTCLEPSAGTGGMADLMPKGRTLCVEVSELHCKILQAKGHEATHADFLGWNRTELKFDRIVMNPPFSEGRWQAHLEHASKMLHDDGRMVAILPASAKSKDVLPGFKCEWHGPYSNEFPGTSVSVVILVATKHTQQKEAK